MASYVIGVDYGTDSVRSVVINATNGAEMGSAVCYYPRWKEGKYCDPARNQFRQHPLDYLESLEKSIRQALAKCPAGTAEEVKGIAIDTTGSTPVAISKDGQPLALLPGLEENPNAMFILWKDHTAVAEAAQINDLAHGWGGENFTKYVGGIYSSEWFWAKMLHVLREDPQIREHAFSWAEHCDWIPAVLTGNTDPLTWKRSRCAAGHKAMWHPEFDGLPSEEFLTRLDPLLKGIRPNLYVHTHTADVSAGTLSPEWASRLGLPVSVVVGVGAFDAHMGAVGAQIEPYSLAKVMGTSTCDILIAPMPEVGKRLVRGICGQVDGSVTPGMLGMEAGQSAFGDVYAWFEELLLWPVEQILPKITSFDSAAKEILMDELYLHTIPELSRQAAAIPVGESGLIALDWLNGRRTPDANQLLKGAIAGLNLGSDAPRVFRALVEATAFGTRTIVERFRAEGIPIRSVIGLGGVATKSAFVMQTVADVLNMPIKVAAYEHTCALGAAMFAAVCAGIYPDIPAAQVGMGHGFSREYQPNPENVAQYEALYAKYCKLGAFVEQELTGAS